MKRLYFIGFPALLIFDTLAQLCFKYASLEAPPPSFELAWALGLFEQPWVYGAVFGYLGAFVMWMTLLKYAPIGPSVAVSHMDLVLITLLSVWIFHEPLNGFKVIGGTLILAGVFCLAKGEAEEERRKRCPHPDRVLYGGTTPDAAR